jgi:hypothetical protein
MMIGIRKSIKALNPLNKNLEILDKDFKIKCSYELVQKRIIGVKNYLPCKFYDYSPLIFEKLRKNYDISNI